MRRIKNGIGHQPRIQLRPNAGVLGDAAIQQLAGFLNNVIGTLNGGLRFGDGTANSNAGNFDAITLHITPFPSTPDTEIVVPHDLNRIPIGVIPIWSDRACRVYSSRGDARAWGDTTKAYLTCDVASANVILVMF